MLGNCGVGMHKVCTCVTWHKNSIKGGSFEYRQKEWFSLSQDEET